MSLFDIFKKKPVETDKQIEVGKEKKPVVKKPIGEVKVEKKSKPKPTAKPKAKTIEKTKQKPKQKPKISQKEKIKEEKQVKEQKSKTGVKPKKALKGTDAWKSLFSPHVTEKATDLAGHNQYIFKVFKRTNKNEIKKAVQSLYGVDVEKVRIINVHRKKKKMGRNIGWKKGYKKAIVKIKKGQEIEVLPR